MTEIKSSRKNITLSRFQEKDRRRYQWDAEPPAGLTAVTTVMGVAGCSSVDSVPAFEAVGRRIDPSQWTQLQFGLFSVPTSVPQLVYQRPWYVLFCLWKSAYKRSLAANRKE